MTLPRFPISGNMKNSLQAIAWGASVQCLIYKTYCAIYVQCKICNVPSQPMGFAHGICKKTFHSNYCIFLNKSHIYHSWCTRQNFIRRHSSTSDEERCLAKLQSERIQRLTSNSPTSVDSRTCIQDSSVLPVNFYLYQMALKVYSNIICSGAICGVL